MNEEDRALPVVWVMTTWYHRFGWKWYGNATSVSFGARHLTTTLLPVTTDTYKHINDFSVQQHPCRKFRRISLLVTENACDGSASSSLHVN